MSEITNIIPYLLSEYVKADNQVMDLVNEYEVKFKTKRFYGLFNSYKRKRDNLAKQITAVGRGGNIVEVKTKRVVLYFTNVSLMDVERILKRDHKNLIDPMLSELTPGKSYLV